MARVRTDLDRRGEDAACAHAQARGAVVLARNWRGGGGELDLVVRDGNEIAFAEVKARSSDAFGTPEDGIDPAKVRRLTRAALAFLSASGLGESLPCRFDVFAVRDEGSLQVEWIKGAFDAAEL
jgi:putative endonuclease